MRLRNYITADDKRWACSQVVELVSESANTDYLGVGSSPWIGDYSTTGVSVPAAPTAAQNNRYLIRLCGIEIPTGRAIRLRGIRQAILLRYSIVVTADPRIVRVVELEQTSPFWSFPDANVSWHIRQQPNRMSEFRRDAAQLPGTTPTLRGLDAALTYNVLAPYRALANGIPPGRDVAHLGTWRDLRYSWLNTDWTLDELITGPGLVTFWASVAQTNPADRPVIPACSTNTTVLRPEDQFVTAFPDAVYGRVAGAMTVEFLTATQGEV